MFAEERIPFYYPPSIYPSIHPVCGCHIHIHALESEEHFAKRKITHVSRTRVRPVKCVRHAMLVLNRRTQALLLNLCHCDFLYHKHGVSHMEALVFCGIVMCPFRSDGRRLVWNRKRLVPRQRVRSCMADASPLYLNATQTHSC